MPRIGLLKPMITEKTMRLAQAGQFTFLVDKSMTKPSIAKQVSQQFKVDVVAVTTGKVSGQDRRTGKRRLLSRINSGKKATLTLKPGQMIEFFKIPEKKSK